MSTPNHDLIGRLADAMVNQFADARAIRSNPEGLFVDFSGGDSCDLRDVVADALRDAAPAPTLEIVSGAEAERLPLGSIVVACDDQGVPNEACRARTMHDEIMRALPYRVLYRAPEPAPAPLAVGDEATTAAQLAALPLRSVVRRTGVPFGEVAERWSDGSGYEAGWYGGLPWRPSARRFEPIDLLPARVLDIPGGTS